MKAEYIDHMGTDLSVVNAAKVSFDKWEDHWITEEEAKALSESTGKDIKPHTKLISYLAKHDHWTPFAHTSIQLRMQAPIPIRTQSFKHKQGFVENEESRRYISSRPALFVPREFRSAPEGSIKQGSGGVHPASKGGKNQYEYLCNILIDTYEDMVTDGICPEQARFILPQGVEVNWIWTGNLYAFANFYNKRTDSHAQGEIQDLATMVGEIVEPLFPVSWKALTNG